MRERVRKVDLVAMVAVGIGAFVVRLVTIWNARAAGVHSDMIEYHDRAMLLLERGLASGLYAFNAWRTPAYPLFLWAHYSAFGVDYLAPRIGQAVLGGVAAILTYGLARQLLTRKRSVIAACVTALYPAAILFSVYLASETLFTCLLLAGLWCWLTASSVGVAALAGLLFGVATMTRAAGLIGLVAIVASVPALSRLGLRPLRAQLFAVLTGFIVVVAPWSYRNYQMYDRVIPLDTNGGFNFLAGNHPEATGRYEWNYASTLETEYYPTAATDLEISDHGYRHGLAFVSTHPGAFLRLALIKLGYLWGLEGREHVWLASVSYFGAVSSSVVWAWGIAVLVSFPLLAIVAVVGLLRPGVIHTPAGAAFAGALLALSALHAISFGEARFHLPVIPLLAIFAAAAFAPNNTDAPHISGRRWMVIAAVVLALCAAWSTQLPMLFERLSAVAGSAPTPSPLVY
ncbi:MAG: glycosyltransferase family 39 protein [Acidobacteria bacterium]|nr:glycosyltransferase family 39 protein [Acidobacteriota bacterium]